MVQTQYNINVIMSPGGFRYVFLFIVCFVVLVMNVRLAVI